MSSLIQEADKFAEQAHGNQKRKYTNEPYIVHPRAVAALVSLVTKDESMIAAALLHDVVEDTDRTIQDIEHNFGMDVAALVEMLTDISKSTDGNRKMRKQIDLEHTKAASPYAKTIKLADLIDNSYSIVEYDKSFARVYLEEKARLLEVLRDGNILLLNMAFAVLQESQLKLVQYELGKKRDERT